MGGLKKETGETPVHTDKVFIFWGDLDDPSPEKIGYRTGIVVPKKDIVCLSVFVRSSEDPVEYYTTHLAEKMRRFGVPRAVIAAHVKVLPYFPKNSEFTIRNRQEVTEALRKVAEEYGSKFFDIPEEKLRSPEAAF